MAVNAKNVMLLREKELEDLSPQKGTSPRPHYMNHFCKTCLIKTLVQVARTRIKFQLPCSLSGKNVIPNQHRVTLNVS